MTAARTVVVAAIAVWACVAAPIADQQTPVFRYGTDAVLVDVSVRQNRRAVTGLTSADFELLDSGVPQTIESSTLESIPLDLTLLLDASGSTEGRVLDRLKQGVLDTVQSLHRDDRLRVLSVQHVIREVVPLQQAGEPIPIERLSPQGGTALHDGLAAVMMRLTTPGRRQLVVAYTDGDDASSITSPAQVLDIALRADAVVHVVVPLENYRARPSSPAAPRVDADAASQARTRADVLGAIEGGAFPGEATLQAIASRTGGRVFVIDLDDSISDAFRDVLADYRTGYLLRYMPQGVPREGWHEITVRVKKPGSYEVRARKGWGS